MAGSGDRPAEAYLMERAAPTVNSALTAKLGCALKMSAHTPIWMLGVKPTLASPVICTPLPLEGVMECVDIGTVNVGKDESVIVNEYVADAAKT